MAISNPPVSTLAPAQIVTIKPASGWADLNLGEVWEYRDLLIFSTMRDIKTRYSQTALGPLWIFIQPLFSMVIYTIIFGVVAKLPTGGIPYPIYSYAGLLPWDFFSDSVNAGLTTLVSNRNLIAKVYFPRLALVFSRILSSLLDLAIAMLITVGMMVYYQLTPNWTIALLPLYLLIASLTGMGFGMLFSGISVKYRDVVNFISYVMRAWMYATPIVYSVESVPEQWRLLYQLNPMANVIIGYRYALLGTGTEPNWYMVGLSVIVALLLFITGLYIFKRVERDIVDVA